VRKEELALILMGVAAVGVGLYLYLTRKKTVTVTNPQNQEKGTVEVSEGVSVSGGRAPVCYETSPGSYYCDSGFKPGDQVVITTSDGRVLTGVVVEAGGGAGVPSAPGEMVREIG
jgi:membrane protein implicated in regulation of membrane protease activity